MSRKHWPPLETLKALREDRLPEFIGRDAVCALTGWTCAILDLRSRTGGFPKPVVVEKSKTVRWKTAEVGAWLKVHPEVKPLNLFFRRPHNAPITYGAA
jgi:predicted DNA-binding transcriptional regulator AlpA